jgi:ligand-binding sensor domain-containing protein
LEDHQGNIWLGTEGGGVSKFDGKKFRNFGEKEGLSSLNIWTAYEDKNHQIWFGTGGSGAIKYDGKEFKTFKETQGQTKNHVQSILKDKKGNMWLGFSGGLYRVEGEKVHNIPMDMLVGC